jgi:hypothetical protein
MKESTLQALPAEILEGCYHQALYSWRVQPTLRLGFLLSFRLNMPKIKAEPDELIFSGYRFTAEFLTCKIR